MYYGLHTEHASYPYDITSPLDNSVQEIAMEVAEVIKNSGAWAKDLETRQPKGKKIADRKGSPMHVEGVAGRLEGCSRA